MQSAILSFLGRLLILFSNFATVALVVSLLVSGAELPRVAFSFGFTVAVSLILGVICLRMSPQLPHYITPQQTFLLVVLSWCIVVLLGSLPIWLSGVCPTYHDAFFESMSGFTTTGSTIFEDVGALPRGILFWRAFIQWLGGMGIITFFLTVLPAVGVGGYKLFRAETSMTTSSKISPRIEQAARVLWMIYAGLTAIVFFFLLIGGMSVFDAVCQSMTTIATGGFSTKTRSIAGFESAYIEWVIIVFMFLAGCNFSLHYEVLRGNFGQVWRSPELRLYVGLIFFSTITITVILFFSGYDYGGMVNTIRYAAFQVVSLVSNTGYTTTDYDEWPQVWRILLILLMVVGGCSGSTAGGLKLVRVIIIGKLIARELKKMVHSRAVFHVKIGDRSVDEGVVTNVVAFCALYLFILALGIMAMAACGLNLEESVASAATAMGNYGPALGSMGPAGNFAHLPWVGKWILSILMLVGRLEIFAIAVFFLPFTWKR